MGGRRRAGGGLVVESVSVLLRVVVVGCLFVLVGGVAGGCLLCGLCLVLKDRCVEAPFSMFVLGIDLSIGVCGEVWCFFLNAQFLISWV